MFIWLAKPLIPRRGGATPPARSRGGGVCVISFSYKYDKFKKKLKLKILFYLFCYRNKNSQIKNPGDFYLEKFFEKNKNFIC